MSPTANSTQPTANGAAGTAAVGLPPGHHRADQAGEEVRAEDPAVEREVAEIVLDHRQDRRHRERLEADQRDGEHEPGGERPPGRREDPAPELRVDMLPRAVIRSIMPGPSLRRRIDRWKIAPRRACTWR